MLPVLSSPVHTGDKVEFNTVDFVESRLFPKPATNRQQLEIDNLSRSTLLPIRATLSPVCTGLKLSNSRQLAPPVYMQTDNKGACSNLDAYRLVITLIFCRLPLPINICFSRTDYGRRPRNGSLLCDVVRRGSVDDFNVY